MAETVTVRNDGDYRFTIIEFRTKNVLFMSDEIMTSKRAAKKRAEELKRLFKLHGKKYPTVRIMRLD